MFPLRLGSNEETSKNKFGDSFFIMVNMNLRKSFNFSSLINGWIKYSDHSGTMVSIWFYNVFLIFVYKKNLNLYFQEMFYNRLVKVVMYF